MNVQRLDARFGGFQGQNALSCDLGSSFIISTWTETRPRVILRDGHWGTLSFPPPTFGKPCKLSALRM